MSLKDFILAREELAQAKEIVFFGGSFNPWHAGHSACIQLLPPEKKLVIVPDHNPYKELVDSKEESLDELKETVLRVRPGSLIYEGFLKANKKNPTFFWIESLKRSFPDKELSLLMGFDTFAGIDNWIESKALLSLLRRLYVVSRLDNPAAKKEQSERLREINPQLELLFLGSHPHEALSSTQLRQEK